MPVSLLAAIWTTVATSSKEQGVQRTLGHSFRGFRQALCSPGKTAAGLFPTEIRSPQMSWWRASVALEQNTSSPGNTPRLWAMTSRASSRRWRARWPSRWMLVGLAHPSTRALATVSTTSGKGGTVALASK